MNLIGLICPCVSSINGEENRMKSEPDAFISWLIHLLKISLHLIFGTFFSKKKRISIMNSKIQEFHDWWLVSDQFSLDGANVDRRNMNRECSYKECSTWTAATHNAKIQFSECELAKPRTLCDHNEIILYFVRCAWNGMSPFFISCGFESDAKRNKKKKKWKTENKICSITLLRRWRTRTTTTIWIIYYYFGMFVSKRKPSSR